MAEKEGKISTETDSLDDFLKESGDFQEIDESIPQKELDVPHLKISTKRLRLALMGFNALSKVNTDSLSNSIFMEVLSGKVLRLSLFTGDSLASVDLDIENDNYIEVEKFVDVKSLMAVASVAVSYLFFIQNETGELEVEVFDGKVSLEGYNFNRNVIKDFNLGESAPVNYGEFYKEISQIAKSFSLAVRAEDRKILASDKMIYGIYLSSIYLGAKTVIPKMVLRAFDVEILKKFVDFVGDSLTFSEGEDVYNLSGKMFSYTFPKIRMDLPEFVEKLDAIKCEPVEMDFSYIQSIVSMGFIFIGKSGNLTIDSGEKGIAIKMMSSSGKESSFLVSKGTIGDVKMSVSVDVMKKLASLFSGEKVVMVSHVDNYLKIETPQFDERVYVGVKIS